MIVPITADINVEVPDGMPSAEARKAAKQILTGALGTDPAIVLVTVEDIEVLLER